MATANSQAVIILPYFCEEEVLRYQQTAQWLEKNCSLPLACEFILAASPKTTPSDSLYRSFARVGSVRHFQCPSQIFGYPQGPTAMFWDCMDFVQTHYSGPGFSLWLESDMAFTKPDWLERLNREWFSEPSPPLLMGCYVPEVYKFRWLRQKKKILDPHINGGACYSLDFASRMPNESREGVFDMAVYHYAQQAGHVKATNQISFSTVSRIRRDLLDDRTCVLHGFMQDKDRFISQCVAPISATERRQRYLHPLHDQMELLRRRVSVCFFRRGRQAMLESVLLAKQRLQHHH